MPESMSDCKTVIRNHSVRFQKFILRGGNHMFTSIIDTTAGTISIQSAMICIGAALVLGIISALVYMLSAERYSSNFILTMALLPALVQVVILMTSGNLGSAVAVLGTFSLIRFRSAAGTAKELLGIFFSMAIGLACGMGQIVFAVIITLVISLMLFLRRHGDEKVLKITIPEDLDYTEIFDDIFAKYTTTAKLQKVKTVNLGSMYELDYDVMLKDNRMEKQMIDDIRVRNGNLNIVCGRHAEDMQVL